MATFGYGVTFRNEISVSLADAATTTLTDATNGVCFVQLNDQCTGFMFLSDGTIVEIMSSDDVRYEDLDGYLCVYASSTQVTIKNQLGSTYTLGGVVMYF